MRGWMRLRMFKQIDMNESKKRSSYVVRISIARHGNIMAFNLISFFESLLS
jgi:hypothetical protein